MDYDQVWTENNLYILQMMSFKHSATRKYFKQQIAYKTRDASIITTVIKIIFI